MIQSLFIQYPQNCQGYTEKAQSTLQRVNLMSTFNLAHRFMRHPIYPTNQLHQSTNLLLENMKS